MLPILPFDLLVPLAIGTSLLVLMLIAAVFTRRFLVHWWSEGGERAGREAERAGDECGTNGQRSSHEQTPSQGVRVGVYPRSRARYV